VLRLGLCCLFKNKPIRFRQTTAKALLNLEPQERLPRVSFLCLENAISLVRSLEMVLALGIGAFRISSQFLPRYTHPEVGYKLDELPDAAEIIANLNQVNRLRKQHDVRLSFHPDQFVLLSSPNPEVTRKSVAELDYQAMLAELVGADVINIHGGGVYGDKASALLRLRENFARLPERVRMRLTLENDDVSYTVADLMPVCAELNIPLVYDVHHHRCNPDNMSIAEATEQCLDSWQKSGRGEAYLHLSSPREGWAARNPKPHADMIDFDDFPQLWLDLNATIDIEAKAKEEAVLEIMQYLSRC
jgi:UV DNA damage endonuclease